jgi:DNA polymerase III epsilon subunit family exonuclease
MAQLTLQTLAFLDVETTGLSPWFGDRVCEIAVLRCEGDKVTDSFDSLINPERPLSPGAARVNGLQDSDLVHAPLFAEVSNRVLALLQEAVIVCHNVPFDLGFLSNELGRASRSLPLIRTLDTLQLARNHFSFASNSLQAIAVSLQIDVRGAHRALGDVFTTREVLRFFSRRLSASDLEVAIQPYSPPLGSYDELDLPPALGEALRGNRRVFIRYVDKKGDSSERWITPKQVLALRDYIYVMAHCHLREEERHFRLDRITHIEPE